MPVLVADSLPYLCSDRPRGGPHLSAGRRGEEPASEETPPGRPVRLSCATAFLNRLERADLERHRLHDTVAGGSGHLREDVALGATVVSASPSWREDWRIRKHSRFQTSRGPPVGSWSARARFTQPLNVVGQLARARLTLVKGLAVVALLEFLPATGHAESVRHAVAGTTPAPVLVVSTSGNDQTCSRGMLSSPCLTFDRAHRLARCGDTVQIAAGRYDDQNLYEVPSVPPARAT